MLKVFIENNSLDTSHSIRFLQRKNKNLYCDVSNYHQELALFSENSTENSNMTHDTKQNISCDSERLTSKSMK